MKSARIICIGRLKTLFWREAWNYYLAQLRPWREISCIELRDGDPALAPAERAREEAERIAASLKKERGLSVALTENGKMLSSRQLAEFLADCDTRLCRAPVFIIGGPFGLTEPALAACSMRLSLSAMTWPHELARVLLAEQLYRADSILRHTRYHH